MQLWFRPRIRHPFFPGLSATPAAEAKGRCVALSGTYLQLTQAAFAGALPRRAVFAVHYEQDPYLNDTQRDSLWQMFQVPVYGLMLDRGRRLIGYECEAQNGLHVPKTAGTIIRWQPCECGRPGPRIQAAAARDFSAAARLLPARA
jgi:hypothetical protein